MKRFQFLLFLLVVIVLGCVYFNQAKAVEDVENKKLVVAVSKLESTTLVRVADVMGYFEEENLDVEMIEDDLGKFSLERLLNDEADVATVAELPFVKQSIKRDDLRLFATIHSSNRNVRLFMLDVDQTLPLSTYKDRVIATTEGTVGEFFLHLFLMAKGINPDEVSILNLKPSDMDAALEDGKISGFALREPHVYKAGKRNEGRAIVYPVDPVDEVYTATFNLVSKAHVLEEKKDELTRLLYALKKAEKYAKEYPNETRKLIAKELNVDESYLDDTWDDSKFVLHLSQTILFTMEDQLRWLGRANESIAEVNVNFLDRIDTSFLERVDSRSQRIFK